MVALARSMTGAASGCRSQAPRSRARTCRRARRLDSRTWDLAGCNMLPGLLYGYALSALRRESVALAAVSAILQSPPCYFAPLPSLPCSTVTCPLSTSELLFAPEEANPRSGATSAPKS